VTLCILVANQASARLYRLEDGALHAAGELMDPLARLHDRDMKSDRPGRVFDHAATGTHRRGAIARHGTGGERTPRRVEARRFARHIVRWLTTTSARQADDHFVVMAGPPFLGLLRSVWPASQRGLIVAEVAKDLVGHPESTVMTHLPPASRRRAS
jgi:protein required for attachment to host cells